MINNGEYWYYESKRILNIKKLITRLRVKNKLKLFTENKNNEILKLFNFLEELGILNFYHLHDFQMVYLDCNLFEIKLQIFKILKYKPLPTHPKLINLDKTYTEQGVAHLIKQNYFNKNMLKMEQRKDLYIAKAFIGGRIETIKTQSANHTKLDFNLFYLNLMRQKLPHGEATFIKKPNNLNKVGFYNVRVDQTKLDIPFLPLRLNGGVEYSKKIFDGIFWVEELEKFIELGGKILNIYDCLAFTKCDEFLKMFIDELTMFYDKKTVKTLVIQLFGSLCVKPWTHPQFLIKDESTFLSEVRLGGIKNFKKIENIFIIEESRPVWKKNCKTNCAAAAAVASKGRIKLYELCLKIGFKNVLSLAIDEVTFNNKLNESELLKLIEEFNLKLVKP